MEILFGHECRDLLIEGSRCVGILLSGPSGERELRAQHTIVATGRRGADWLEKICAEHGIAHQPGTVDIGVRVEVRSEVMELVNEVLYESKLIGYPRPFKTRCAPSARIPAAL